MKKMPASKYWCAAIMLMVLLLAVFGCSGKSNITVPDKSSTSVNMDENNSDSKSEEAFVKTEIDSPLSAGTNPIQQEQTSTSVKSTDKGNVEESPISAPELDAADSKEKARIDRSFETRFDSLRSECMASGEQLVVRISDELNGKDEVSLSQIQSKYMGQVAKAEAACDARFASLLEQAEAEYTKNDLSIAGMPAWKTDYEKEKNSMRLAAIGKLLKAYQNTKGASEK